MITVPSGVKMMAQVWPISHLSPSGILGALALIFVSLFFSSQLALAQFDGTTPTWNGYDLGHALASSGTATFTVTADATVGSLIVVTELEGANHSTPSAQGTVTDSQGNHYTLLGGQGLNRNPANGLQGAWYSLVTHKLTN